MISNDLKWNVHVEMMSESRNTSLLSLAIKDPVLTIGHCARVLVLVFTSRLKPLLHVETFS